MDAMPKIKGITSCGRRGFDVVKPGEVIERLQEWGISISASGLRNWEKWGLIPTADRKSGGRGLGKITEYPDVTPYELYASWVLMKGRMRLRKEYIREVREAVLTGKWPIDGNNDNLMFYWCSTWRLLSKGPQEDTTDYGTFDPEDPLYKSVKAKMDEWRSKNN